MSRPPLDGDKLLKIMKVKGVNKSALAAEMSITPTSIGRYFTQLNKGSIDEDVWASMLAALRRLGVDDAEGLRPVQNSKVRRDLLPLVSHFTTDEQIRAVLQILDGHPGSQEILRIVLEDRLKRQP